MTEDQPQQFPAYQPPKPVRQLHPDQGKILLKVLKHSFKRSGKNSLTIRKRKRAKVI